MGKLFCIIGNGLQGSKTSPVLWGKRKAITVLPATCRLAYLQKKRGYPAFPTNSCYIFYWILMNFNSESLHVSTRKEGSPATHLYFQHSHHVVEAFLPLLRVWRRGLRHPLWDLGLKGLSPSLPHPIHPHPHSCLAVHQKCIYLLQLLTVWDFLSCPSYS